MSELVRFTVSIEEPLFNKLEELVADANYKNRSEFIRDMIREHQVELGWQGDSELLGTLLLLFNHHTRGLTERLVDIQHHFIGQVIATTHVHLEDHICAEMLMIRGKGKDIKDLVDKLRREKGVLHAKLATGSTGSKLS